MDYDDSKAALKKEFYEATGLTAGRWSDRLRDFWQKIDYELSRKENLEKEVERLADLISNMKG